jgi:transcription elongation GreA/GreB family factor
LEKSLVHSAYTTLVHNKINVLKNELSNLLLDAENETKSSAGDKHETAISLLQLQQEKISFQLNEAHIQLQALQKINPTQTNTTVNVGSLVHTNKGYLYISLALGKVAVNGLDVMAVSVLSPIGEALKGHVINDTVLCNNIQFTILFTS